MAKLDQSREFRFSPLSQAQLAQMEEVRGVTEIHDRLIAAEALVWQAPIITNDEVLRRSGVAPIIW
jgi:PIN domain nuclease of toxin-antitoxin system